VKTLTSQCHTVHHLLLTRPYSDSLTKTQCVTQSDRNLHTHGDNGLTILHPGPSPKLGTHSHLEKELELLILSRDRAHFDRLEGEFHNISLRVE